MPSLEGVMTYELAGFWLGHFIREPRNNKRVQGTTELPSWSQR